MILVELSLRLFDLSTGCILSNFRLRLSEHFSWLYYCYRW
jgi:hypothetical protein